MSGRMPFSYLHLKQNNHFGFLFFYVWLKCWRYRYLHVSALNENIFIFPTGGRQHLWLKYSRKVWWNHKKNNVIFLLGSPRQSYSVYEKKAKHLRSPSAPTQPPTHIWATQLSAHSATAHARSHRKERSPSFSVCSPLKSLIRAVTLTRSHTYTHTSLYFCLCEYFYRQRVLLSPLPSP